MSNLRILIDSNAPFEHTGYGRQTKYLCEMFSELGHEVGVVAMHGLQGSAIYWRDIPIFPQRKSRYCLEEMRSYVEYFNADVVITLFDLWHFPPNSAELLSAPWIAMTPVEGAPIGGHLAKLLRKASYVVSYSQFGYETLLDAHIPSTLLPHTVDTSLYKPGNAQDQAEIRDRFGLDQDAWVITMVAMNKGAEPYRKAWPEMLAAWKQVTEVYPEAFFYAHTNKWPMVPNYEAAFKFDPYIQALEIPRETVGFPAEGAFTVGIPDEEMVNLYRASDVVILPSMAEGFGLPVIEAQACGTPILAHDCSAMTELVYYGGLIPRGESHWIAPRNYWWYRPNPDDIFNSLVEMRDFDQPPETGHDVMQELYSPEALLPKWDEFLSQVEAELW